MGHWALRHGHQTLPCFVMWRRPAPPLPLPSPATSFLLSLTSIAHRLLVRKPWGTMAVKWVLFSLVLVWACVPPAWTKPLTDTGGERREMSFPRTRRHTGAEIQTQDPLIRRQPALTTVPPPPPVEEQMDVCLITDPDALNIEVIYQHDVDDRHLWLKNGPLPDCSSESEPVLLESCRVCKKNDLEVEATCRRVRSSAELHVESDGKTLQKNCSSHVIAPTPAPPTQSMRATTATPTTTAPTTTAPTTATPTTTAPTTTATPTTATPTTATPTTTAPTTAAPPLQSDATPPSGLGAGAIAGIIFGVLGVLVVLGALGRVAYTRRERIRSWWSSRYSSVPRRDQNGTDVGNETPAANGHAPNGHAPNGHGPNGPAPNGHADTSL